MMCIHINYKFVKVWVYVAHDYKETTLPIKTTSVQLILQN